MLTHDLSLLTVLNPLITVSHVTMCMGIGPLLLAPFLDLLGSICDIWFTFLILSELQFSSFLIPFAFFWHETVCLLGLSLLVPILDLFKG